MNPNAIQLHACCMFHRSLSLRLQLVLSELIKPVLAKFYTLGDHHNFMMSARMQWGENIICLGGSSLDGQSYTRCTCGPNFGPFSSTNSWFRDTRLSKIGIALNDLRLTLSTIYPVYPKCSMTSRFQNRRLWKIGNVSNDPRLTLNR